MIRRPPRSTRTDHSFPTRRSSDLFGGNQRCWRPARVAQFPALDRRDYPEPIRSAVPAWDIQRLPDCGRGASCLHPPRQHKYREPVRSEEHTSELQSLMRISYAVFCLKIKKIIYILTKNVIKTEMRSKMVIQNMNIKSQIT